MKRSLSILIATAISITGLVVSPHEASANVVVPKDKPRIAAARCTVAKGRITNMADTMKAVSERRATIYANAREKTTARVTVLKQKNYDTGKLEADLKKLDAQIADYRVKTKALYTSLTDARETACGDSEGAFRDAIVRARTQLRSAREASLAIHQTFRSSVIPDIKAAVSWLKNN